MMKEGVIIVHSCGHNLFINKKTLEDNCAIICRGCGNLISFSLFESTMKRQLLKQCEKWTDEEIKERLK